MMPFRERNPVTIGVIGLTVIALMMLGAFRANDLPLIGGGDAYYAEFAEAGGLRVGDEVRIAGVRVGDVQDIKLAGDRVRVEFQVDEGAEFGEQTGADIKIRTILGKMFLALRPAGPGQLAEDTSIPLSRTTSPFDTVEAFTGLASTAGRIDSDQLSESLDTMTEMLQDTPEELRGTLRGLSRISRTVASRDQELNTLLKSLDKVSTVLADRDQELTRLLTDGDLLLRAVYNRRQAIHDLLVATQELSRELSALVRDTREDLRPALRQLESVVAMLRRNQENIDESLRLLAPFARIFTNTLGNGPWWDTFVQNMPPVPDLTRGQR